MLTAKLADDVTELWDRDKLIATVKLSEIERIYHAALGSVTDANEVEFWVIERADGVIVVPDETSGFRLQVLPRWQDELERGRKIFQIRCSQPPLSWTKKFLGIPTLQVRLAQHSKQTMPAPSESWSIDGPFSLSEAES